MIYGTRSQWLRYFAGIEKGIIPNCRLITLSTFLGPMSTRLRPLCI